MSLPPMAPLVPLDWMAEARCVYDPESFFPDSGDNAAAAYAKSVCRRCPVQPQCLELALANEERFGVWGGMSERERRKITQQHRAGRAPLDVQAVTDLAAQGRIDREIADQLGSTKDAVWQARKRHGIPAGRSRERGAA